MVAFDDGDGVDACLAGTAEIFQGSFFNNTLFGTQHDGMFPHEILILEVLHIHYSAYFIILGNIDEVLNGPALAALFSIGDLVDIQPVAPALFRKEQHGMVGRGYEKMLDIILFPGAATYGPPAAATLLAVFGGRGPLDIPEVGNSDDDIFFADEVLNAHLVVEVGDLCLPGVAELIFYFLQFLANNIKAFAFVGQQLFQPGDQLHQSVVFFPDLTPFHPGEALKTQFEDGFRLDFVQAPAGVDQVVLCHIRRRTGADQGNHFIQVIQCDQVTL